jgi:hypothetical protein
MDERREQEGVPADPSGIEEPHDVLAAEEFEIGTRDDRYPADPSGIEEPHDVLAAEEFAMPAGGANGSRPATAEGPDLRSLLPLALACAVAAYLLLRRRS